jgi:hypothetical protein
MHVEVMPVEVLGEGLGSSVCVSIFGDEQSLKCKNCGLQSGLL